MTLRKLAGPAIFLVLLLVMTSIWPAKVTGTVGYAAAVLGANVFILLYGFLAPWWKRPFGRHLFTFMLVVAVVLNHGVVQLLFPEYPGRQNVRAILNAAVAGVIWWRVMIFIRVQIGRRHGVHQEEEH